MTKMESSDWLVNWRKRLPTCMSLGTTKICPDTKNQPIRLKNKRDMGKKLYFSFFSLCVCSGSGRVSGRAKLTQTSKRTFATASVFEVLFPGPGHNGFLPISRLFFNRIGWCLECGQISIVPTDMQSANCWRQLTSQSELSISAIGFRPMSQVFLNRSTCPLNCS